MEMIRKAKPQDAKAIHKLIQLYAEKEQMLVRSLSEIRQNISSFLVCEQEGRIVGACSLKYGWDRLVEIRSLAVAPNHYRQGIGTTLVNQALEEAAASGAETIFVLTYVLFLFEKLGFKVVEKDTLPFKVWNDCQSCLHQDNCDETAMALSLVEYRQSVSGAPLAMNNNQ